MAKILERRKAILLRNKGKTYSEIRGIIKVSKSTLSLWLKFYPLSTRQLQRVNKNKYRAIEKFRLTMRKKREKRLDQYYQAQQKRPLPFSRKELLIAGLLLYWGEGNKASSHTISLNNNDPGVLKFALYWLLKGLLIPKSKIKIYLHLYKDMDIEKEITYWSKMLDISKANFIKPYIKESSRSEIDQKGFGHGTCGVTVHDTKIKETILMGIKGISDYYGKKIADI